MNPVDCFRLPTCRHSFHKECILSHATRGNSGETKVCPLCRIDPCSSDALRNRINPQGFNPCEPNCVVVPIQLRVKPGEKCLSTFCLFQDARVPSGSNNLQTEPELRESSLKK